MDLKDAIRAEVVVEIANQHMGFEGMTIRLNSNQWYSIHFPASSPKDPPFALVSSLVSDDPDRFTDLKEGQGTWLR